MSAPPGGPGGPPPAERGSEVDLDAPSAEPEVPAPAGRSRRWPRRRRVLAGAVVALVLAAGWVAQQPSARHLRPGGTTGDSSPRAPAVSAADAARLERLLALDSAARRLGASDPRMLAALQAEAACARAAASAPVPAQAERVCQDQLDGVQQQVWDDAYIRTHASPPPGVTP